MSRLFWTSTSDHPTNNWKMDITLYLLKKQSNPSRSSPRFNTSSCIMAINRLVACRGRPDTCWLDYGTNFDSASREVKTIETSALREKCAQRRIKRNLNTPSAPNQGGVWENLIESCKRILLTIFRSRKHLTSLSRTRNEFQTPCSCKLRSNRSESLVSVCGKVLQPAVFAREPDCAQGRQFYQQAQHYAVAI